MSDWHVLTMLGLGFLLGLRHALDADHVAAVSTVVARSSSIWRSGAVGAWWGLGHTLMLMVAGVVVVGFKVVIPEELAQWFEFVVGIMLVLLGVSLARAVLREDWHWHVHEHDGSHHRHLHHHRSTPDHVHPHWLDGTFQPFVVGMVHGLAGSAALLLLVVAAVETMTEALTYIAVFGVGSILGMMAVGALISLPLVYAEKWGPLARLSMRGVLSFGSVVVGVWTMISTGLLRGLF